MKNQLPIIFWAMCSIVALSSCKSEKAGETTTDTPTADTTSVTTGYPAMGTQDIAMLYSQVDKVDIIFYNLPISVNQEDPTSAKNTALYVSPASPRIREQCQALGRLTFMSDGEIIREADVFCEPGCEYLLFIENNKPIYANAMGHAGIAFFNNVRRQVDQKTNGQ